MSSVTSDGDSLAGAIAGVREFTGVVEAAEEGVPGLGVVFSAGEVLEEVVGHAVDEFLVGVGVVPPVAGSAIPGGGVGVADPDDAARVDSFAGADGVVGLVGGFEGGGRGRSTALLGEGLPRQYAGRLGGGERTQEACSFTDLVGGAPPARTSARGHGRAGTV